MSMTREAEQLPIGYPICISIGFGCRYAIFLFGLRDPPSPPLPSPPLVQPQPQSQSQSHEVTSEWLI
jgi:hypothetical protein